MWAMADFVPLSCYSIALLDPHNLNLYQQSKYQRVVFNRGPAPASCLDPRYRKRRTDSSRVRNGTANNDGHNDSNDGSAGGVTAGLFHPHHQCNKIGTMFVE